MRGDSEAVETSVKHQHKRCSTHQTGNNLKCQCNVFCVVMALRWPNPHNSFHVNYDAPNKNSDLLWLNSPLFCDLTGLAPVSSFISSTGTCTTTLSTTPLQKRDKASGALRCDPVESSCSCVASNYNAEYEHCRVQRTENSSLVLPPFFSLLSLFFGV